MKEMSRNWIIFTNNIDFYTLMMYNMSVKVLSKETENATYKKTDDFIFLDHKV